MDEQTWMAERFEEHRGHLRAVAYRMLGSASEADDALQEAWLRLSRADASSVENLPGWLTTVVARVCLNMLRSRRRRREDPLEDHAGEPADVGLEQEALLADSIGPALLVVLDTLAPAERLAFVLHDMFAVPFGEIATILGRSPDATRQLASRARRRVQGTAAEPAPQSDLVREREVVGAFLAAARSGDFEGLLAMLDPDVVMRIDSFAARSGAGQEVRGAEAVVNGARRFAAGARFARLALIDGTVGAVLTPGGRMTVAVMIGVRDGRIAALDVIGDPARLAECEVSVLDD